MNYTANSDKKKLNKSNLLMLIIIIVGLLYIALIKINNTKHDSTNLSGVNNEVIKKLEEQSSSNYKVKHILNNTDKYPESLLTMLSKNIETVDFVYNYPKNILKENNKNISIKKYYTPGEIPLFIQWDEKWGYNKYGDEYLSVSGCAPTSLAMVSVGLTGDTSVNPLAVSEYAFNNGFYVNGIGSSWNLISEGAKHFGLNAKELPLSKSSILSTLKAGNPIIITVGPGTFTSTGHFLVLTGLADDGKIKINDPNSKINSSKTWDVDVFLKETKNLWKISKL